MLAVSQLDQMGREILPKLAERVLEVPVAYMGHSQSKLAQKAP